MVLASESQVRVILLDIEGTTTPIDFVTKTLFPYASRKLEDFLRDHFDNAEIQSLIQDLQAQHQLDEPKSLQPPSWTDPPTESRLRSAIAYGHWLIARDSKCTPLKALQGKIWQHGYASGELRGQVYSDVPSALTRWQQQKKEICIYSSGSVLAQRLLFSSVPSGDLTPYIAGFFDTQIGAKSEPDSYRNIAASVGRKPEEVLFISDAVKEIETAKRAGMQAILCVRDAQATAPTSTHRMIRNFDELFPE